MKRPGEGVGVQPWHFSFLEKGGAERGFELFLFAIVQALSNQRLQFFLGFG